VLGPREERLELRVSFPKLLARDPRAKGRVDAGFQLVFVVRLRQVIVCTDMEAFDALLHFVLHGEHDDDDVAGALGEPQPAANAQTVEVVEQNVEDDDIRWIGLDRLERIQPTAYRARLEAPVLHEAEEMLSLFPRVFNDENLCFHEVLPEPSELLSLQVDGPGWESAM
jgi:hypothetical protein